MAGRKKSDRKHDGWDNMTPETQLESSRINLDDPRYNFFEKNDEQGKLYFPIEFIPEGWTYVWVNERLMNEDQPQNIMSHVRRGFDFVPASDHPEFSMPHIDHRLCRDKDDGHIRAEGSVLMKIPTEVFNRRKQAFNDKSTEIHKQAVAATDYLGNTPTGFVPKEHVSSGYGSLYAHTKG
jgi:hypothetical protein